EPESKLTRRQFARHAALGLVAGQSGRAAAGESAHPSIVGKWVGRAANGDKITYLFKPDNTVLWSVDTEDFPGRVSARYVIDYPTQPVHLDVFEFGFPSLAEFIFLGILEFDGPTRFKLFGTPEKFSGDAKRPRAFTPEAIVFSKVE